MKKFMGLSLLILLSTGCPGFEKKTYRFDLKNGSGTLLFETIYGSDSDFRWVIEKGIEGTFVEESHPGWNISEKALSESDGHLNALISFSFDDPAAAGIFVQKKRGPYIWCESRSYGGFTEPAVISATNGTAIPELPGCVIWKRKTPEMWVEITYAEPSVDKGSLVEQFNRWTRGESFTGAKEQGE